MSKLDMSELDRPIDDLPSRFKGPGGAVAVLKDGEVIARQTWGFADLKPLDEDFPEIDDPPPNLESVL